MNRAYTRPLLAAAASLVLTACGGGGGSGGGTGAPEFRIAAFLDSEVEGLAYQNPGVLIPSPFGNIIAAGISDQFGRVEYAVGEELVFSVGNVALPSLADGKTVITPYDFGTEETAINIAQFLITIDADDQPENGIEISAETADLLADLDPPITGETFEQDAATFAIEIQPALDALSIGSLVNRTEAADHLQLLLNPTFVTNDLADQTFLHFVPNATVFGLFGISRFNGDGSAKAISGVDTSPFTGKQKFFAFDWAVDGGGIVSEYLIDEGSPATIVKTGESQNLVSFEYAEGEPSDDVSLGQFHVLQTLPPGNYNDTTIVFTAQNEFGAATETVHFFGDGTAQVWDRNLDAWDTGYTWAISADGQTISYVKQLPDDELQREIFDWNMFALAEEPFAQDPFTFSDQDAVFLFGYSEIDDPATPNMMVDVSDMIATEADVTVDGFFFVTFEPFDYTTCNGTDDEPWCADIPVIP